MISCALPLAEGERPLQQRRGAAVERALLGRAAHERGQLLGRAGGGELLLRLDPDPPQDRVRGAVEEARSAAGPRRVKPRWKPWTALAVASGSAIARFFGTSSPNTIVTPVARTSAIAERDAVDGALGQPGRLQRPVDEPRDRRLGQVADQQVRDRDPELRRRQLRRQAAQRLLARPAAPRSPRSAARSTDERSTVTNANSAATNAPHAATSASATRMSRISINAHPPPGVCAPVLQLGSSLIDDGAGSHPPQNRPGG